MSDDPHRALKTAFGRYATGVTVVSCLGADGAPTAITVNSFASVSLSPPLVLWSIEKSASTFDRFMASPSYAVSVLRSDQQDVSQRFAQHGGRGLDASEFETWETGCPVLKERMAGFDCKIIDRHVAGDHVVLIAEVLRFDLQQGAPLLYFDSAYAVGPKTR
ncbi:MAG: flavin reductase family protein [Pseudomonadota bacterium]